MKNLKIINRITKDLKLIETGELISVYMFLKDLLNERIESGHINGHQLKDIANMPLINDDMRNEILKWK